jgi:hypothetical protein
MNGTKAIVKSGVVPFARVGKIFSRGIQLIAGT